MVKRLVTMCGFKVLIFGNTCILLTCFIQIGNYKTYLGSKISMQIESYNILRLGGTRKGGARI